MTSPAQAGTDQAMVPGNDHNAPPAFSVNPAGVITADDPAPPASAVSQHPGAGPATAAAQPDTGAGAVALAPGRIDAIRGACASRAAGSRRCWHEPACAMERDPGNVRRRSALIR